MILTGTIPEPQNPNIRTQQFIDKKKKHIYFLCDRKSYENMRRHYNIKSRIVRIHINNAIDLSYTVNQVCKIKIKLVKLKMMNNGKPFIFNKFMFQDIDVLY